jgi:hypothetical protein
MMRYLFALILGLALTAFLAVVYLISPRRDAEVALGLKSLPWSACNLMVSRDVWAGYVVRGYMEVSSEDFEHILSLRAYERSDHPEFPLSEEPLPAGRNMTSAIFYRWVQGDSRCEMKCDATRSWIWFVYSTD